METSLANIERDLLLWAGRVAAGEAELLALIGEWDAREGWGAAGALSCAHWVSWKLGYGLVASRERVRIARALRELPATARAMAAGELSYSQARAMTRVASADDEQMWLDLARQTTAEQLQKAVRGVIRARQPEVDAASDPEDVEYRNRTRQRWNDDGNLDLTFIITPVEAPGVIAALEASQAAVQADRDAQMAAVAAPLATGHASAEAPVTAVAAPEEYYYQEPDYPGMAYLGRLPSEMPADLEDRIKAWQLEKAHRRARAQAWQDHQQRIREAAEKQGTITRKATLTDGLIRLLAGGATTVKLNLMIDPMSGWARTSKDEFLPPAITTEILAKHGQQLPRIRPITAADLLRLDQGRSSRLVTPKLRALLGQLDGECCRFPGCTRTTKLQAHHVIYWRDGGCTDLTNLTLVCSRHHTLIHEQGFQLELRADRTLIVTTADSKRLEPLPRQPWRAKEELDPNRQVTTASIPTQWNGDPLNLHHVAWVLAQHAA